MNANELADELDWHWDNDCRSPAISKSADMLRQLQTENEELKAKIEGLDMVIWKLQTTITNRELRTYDGKLE
jgi:hypothetical protein